MQEIEGSGGVTISLIFAAFLTYEASSRSKSDFFGIVEGQFTITGEIIFLLCPFKCNVINA